MSVKPKRIGIFGGTFDPVHNGHLSIAKSFLSSNFIDELWVMLNPAPPHKPDEEFAPFATRLRMLKDAFEPIKHAIVSDIEQHLPAPTYTVQTVAHLTDTYPDYTFYLCIGKDSFVTFQTWHKWKDILAHCSLLVADRSVTKNNSLYPRLKANATFVEHTPLEVSSTQIRKKVAAGKSVDYLVPKSVSTIIKDEHLYVNL